MSEPAGLCTAQEFRSDSVGWRSFVAHPVSFLSAEIWVPSKRYINRRIRNDGGGMFLNECARLDMQDLDLYLARSIP